MSDWIVGGSLGPYALLAHVGTGGMGEVWKARDTRLNRIVAVKRLKSGHSGQFEREARLIAALNHPNICQIFDIGPDYLVLEYVEGTQLAGPLPATEVVRLGVQVAKALDAAHRKGVVHRDLKPGNVMVTSEGAVKLLDFGIAKLSFGGEEADDTQTMESAVTGTAAYLAPERATGKPADARSDIFSFGALLYELLSGRRAFSEENPISTIAAILYKDPDPLEAPFALQQIVKRCMAKSPADRFQNMADVARAMLGNAAEGSERPSIAVLPFANLSPDKTDDTNYFSDGLAEEIINALARIPELKVTARTSAFAYREKQGDIREIAEALDVRNVLEGSVRRAGNRIRIMAQLIDARDGYRRWSQRYDRELADVFELQDEIAQAIAAALEPRLSRSAVVPHYRPSLPAYEALLRARYYFGSGRFDLDSLNRAKAAFEEAIELDPNFALAHSEYGLYYIAMTAPGLSQPDSAMATIRDHASRALELNPSLPEGHAMLGAVAGLYDFDWEEAGRRFRNAMASAVVPPLVRGLYAYSHLMPLGRPEEAIQELDRALRADPLNFSYRMPHAMCLAALGRDEQAIDEMRRVLELTASPVTYGALGMFQYLRGDWEEARRTLAKAASIPNSAGLLAALLHRTGEISRAGEILRNFPADSVDGTRARAVFSCACGDLDTAVDWWERAIEMRDIAVPFALQIWFARVLRGTPHRARLMRKLNLPE